MKRRAVRHQARNDLTEGAWVLRAPSASGVSWWVNVCGAIAQLAVGCWSVWLIAQRLIAGEGAWGSAALSLALNIAVALWLYLPLRLATVRRRQLDAWPRLQGHVDLLVEVLADQERMDRELPLHREDQWRRHQKRDMATAAVVRVVRPLSRLRAPDRELVLLAEHETDRWAEKLRADPPNFYEVNGMLSQRDD